MESGLRLYRVAVAAGLLVLSSSWLHAASCSVRGPHEPSVAEQALLNGDFAKAEGLYREALARQPGDNELIAGLVRTLLREQKVNEAAETVAAALKPAPGSAALISLRGEVELRQGLPWLAAASANDALQRDPCLARNLLLLARLDTLNSMYASSLRAVTTAHQLDPTDPEIRRQWLFTLPLKQRLAEAEAYGASPNGSDADEARRWKEYVDDLRREAAAPRKACRLVSNVESTQIPLTYIWVGYHAEGFGFPVKLNNKASLLEVDTGASGILISRHVAERAGLKVLSTAEVGGIGDQGEKAGYSAFVDRIRIGDIEFQDCAVTVVDGRYVSDALDGLIGMDVLSNFLVTLDFPGRKLHLEPLPKRPDGGNSEPSLTASDDDAAEPEDVAEPVAGGTGTGSANNTQAAAKPPAPAVRRGPFDRYISPEMKGYALVYRSGHNLLVPTALNGSHPKLFILDTGAWATSISPDAAQEVTKVQRDYFQRVTGLSGEVGSVYKANQVTFTFASVSHKVDGVPSFDTSKLSKDLGVEVSGFLGAQTLDWLTIHIDYRDGLVKCEYDAKRNMR